MKLSSVITLFAAAVPAANALIPGALVKVPHTVPAGRLSSYQLLGQFRDMGAAGVGTYKSKYEFGLTDGSQGVIQVLPISETSVQVIFDLYNTTAKVNEDDRGCKQLDNHVQCIQAYEGEFEGFYKINIGKASTPQKWLVTFSAATDLNVANLEFPQEYFVNGDQGMVYLVFDGEVLNCEMLPMVTLDLFSPPPSVSNLHPVSSYGEPVQLQQSQCLCKMNFSFYGAGIPHTRPLLSISVGREQEQDETD